MIQRFYPELMRFRREALAKVGARWHEQIGKVPARVYWPQVSFGANSPKFQSVSLGPLTVSGMPPAFDAASRAIDAITPKRSHYRVLDVGCGAGILRDYLADYHPGVQFDYVGIDIAPPDVAFPVYRDIADVPAGDFDVIMMSEIAEHLPVDYLMTHYLSRIGQLLSADGTLILGLPNPLAPTVLQRDITHVQHYPWYDLYAILRFFFEDVQPLRTFVMQSPSRLMLHPLKRLICAALEVDWCEGLLFTARRPHLAVEWPVHSGE